MLRGLVAKNFMLYVTDFDDDDDGGGGDNLVKFIEAEKRPRQTGVSRRT